MIFAGLYYLGYHLNTGATCYQRIALNGFYVRRDYPEHLRRVKCKDIESGKTQVFLTFNRTVVIKLQQSEKLRVHQFQHV